MSGGVTDSQGYEGALAQLLIGDARVYETVFAAAAAIEPAALRYRVRRDAIEAGLAAAADAPAGKLAAIYAAVAEQALGVLADEPREPLLLNYAGVALYELGELDGAAALFGAAGRLDPELAHLRRNVEQVERRRGVARPVLPPAVAARLRALGDDAERVAAAAREPVTGLTLSLCMIVKDEQEMLPRSLAAARDAVDEIVVVDTGSSDRSVEIARSFGARVIEREWTGSFADARNASFDAATGDWVLYLDADEVLVAEDAPLLRELTGRTWREAFYLVETNHTGELGDGTAVTHNALRLFRNRPEYRFEGRVHEQIAHCLPHGQPERIEPTRVRVEHYGYLGVVRDAKEKSRRNIELLRREAADSAPTPFLCFNLGSELAAAGEAVAAREQFEQAWELLAEDPDRAERGFAPSLTARLVKSLRVTGDYDAALARAGEGLELFPGFTDLVLEQAQVARAQGDGERAARLLERCLELGDAPSRYSSTVGCGSYLALVALAELEAERGEHARAERLLRDCLAAYPAYLGSVLPLAQAMLARGAEPDAVVATISEGVADVTPSVRFTLATALYDAGHAAAAEPLFAAVVERQPDNGFARLALAEALLSQERWNDAADAVAGVAADGSSALATHGELFQPAVAAMLEALLGVEAFEAFERLLPALDAIGLPARERRELLAAIYLRRGFLESAADEWIAACEEAGGPDAAALGGLAQVAAARGLEEDARLLAAEAEKLASSPA
jgi:tetratricopeptide (TPR) repeat protein